MIIYYQRHARGKTREHDRSNQRRHQQCNHPFQSSISPLQLKKKSVAQTSQHFQTVNISDQTKSRDIGTQGIPPVSPLSFGPAVPRGAPPCLAGVRIMSVRLPKDALWQKTSMCCRNGLAVARNALIAAGRLSWCCRVNANVDIAGDVALAAQISSCPG